jgi:hypothetical protein
MPCHAIRPALRLGWAFLAYCAISIAFAGVCGTAFAKGPQLQEKINEMLDPVRGLNSDLQIGLQRIEQTCAIISKSKLIEANQKLSGTDQVNLQKLSEDLSTAKESLVELRRLVKRNIAIRKQAIATSPQKCDLTRLNTTEICKLQQAQSENINAVSDASDYYYQEALERLKNYDKAQELESRGCTRPGFTFRLWISEKTHLMPTLDTSAVTFTELLK